MPRYRAGVTAPDPPDPAVRVLARRPGRIVSRVRTPDGPAVRKEGGTFDAEVAAIARLAAAGLPVPRVLAHEPGRLLLSWTDGDGLSAASSPAAQRDAGRILRRVHDLTAEPDQPVVRWIAGWLDAIAGWWPDPAGYRPTTGERAAFDRLIPFFTVMRALAAAQWHQQHGDPALVIPMLDRAGRDLGRAGRG